MRKGLLLLMASLLIVNVYAVGKVKLIGGFASSNISFSRDPGSDVGVDISSYQKSKLGLVGGIGFEMGSQFGVEIDILYIQKGVKFEGSGSDPLFGEAGSFNVSANLDEVSVPVLLRYRFLEGTSPYILGGGEVAYIISSKAKYTATDNATQQTYSGTEDLDQTENLNKLDYGLVFGVGLEVTSLAVPIFIEGRYHMGLANIFKTTADTPAQAKDNDWVRTKAVIVTLGIKF
jgi:opacity protein-like surface antigen